jgi:hypothetical protein
MAEDRTGYGHDASDRKLDEASEVRGDDGSRNDIRQASGPEYDPAEIRQHDDTGKDRLFEDRQQHDEAEKNSEKTRLARDVDRHDHDVDTNVADAGTQPGAKRKN